MADQIRVLIVDDIPETRDHLSKLLGFETDIEVVGAAASGREAIEMASQLTPDVVLMDINMPDMDGIAATERLSAEVPDRRRRDDVRPGRGGLPPPLDARRRARVPRQAVQLRRADVLDPPGLHAGAREAVADRRPAGRRRRGHRRPLLAAWAPSASPASPAASSRCSGRRAASAARRSRSTSRSPRPPSSARRPASSTASFQFGDVGVLLNLNPKNKSIADLIPELEQGEPESIDTFVINHSAGIRVLLAPPSPEMAELITPVIAKRMIEALRNDHDLVVVDCMSSFNDTTLAILDLADTVLTMLSLEITSIKNIRLFLEVADQLGYGSDKVRLVLNRADSSLGIRVADVEHSIGRRVDHTIVSDGRSVVYALNRGVPFFLSNREAQVSQDVLRLASAVVGTKEPAEAGESPRRPPRRSPCSRGDDVSSCAGPMTAEGV